MNHKLLRELFRHLQAFKALFENEGIDSITAPDGEEYCLYDIDYLYQCTQRPVRLTPSSEPEYLLSPRQRQAIELFLYCNIREKDVAVLMGVSDTNPIAIYATQGLSKLCALIESGSLSRYKPAFGGGEYANSVRRASAVGGDGERVDSPVTGRGDGPLREGGHPDALEGTRPAEQRGLQLVGHGGPGNTAGDVPPRMELAALPPELTRWRRARAADSVGAGGLHGPGGQALADGRAHVEGPRGVDSRLYRLTIRWGKQVRLKCAQCTRYVKSNDGGDLHCSCGCSYRHVQDDFYELIGVAENVA